MLHRIIAIALLGACLHSTAFAQTGGDDAPLEEIVVTGEYPGPGMWKVMRPGDDSHVLWIIGDPPPLPKRMKWKSREVEAVAERSQEILRDATMSMEPDEKIGLFRGLSLLPSALKARTNPDDGTLRDQLPPELYARWLVQKKRFLGHDSGVEDFRPIVAADKLRKAAFEDLGLRDSGMVWEVVGKLAKKQNIPVTTPTIKFSVHTREIKDKLREFSHESLPDTECFARTLDLTEALSDTATEARRAQAWATADLATLESLPPLPNPFVPCAMALMSSTAARELVPADIREQIYVSWTEAAVQALSTNTTTLAIAPLSKLTRQGGYLARLRERGYTIEPPK